MISPELQKQISELCSSHPPAKPVIDAIIASFDGKTGSQARAMPAHAVEYTEIALILPSRRKCSLHIHENGVWLTANGAVVLDFEWKEIVRVACLPVPDKPKPTWNLIFSKEDPHNSVVLALGQTSADKHKANSKPGPLKEALCADIELHSPLQVYTTFSLAVTAHIGSKEGVLYMLEDALIYGHKKPILFLPHKNVASFSYTVITRSTFNIVVKMTDDSQHEFGMIDQDHYPKIYKYASIHGLLDESLAAEHAAKRSRLDDDLGNGINELGAIATGRDTQQQGDDEDDRESDLDVEFSDRELDSDGSGESEPEDSSGIDLDHTADVDEEINTIQTHQLEDQQDDEDDEEQGFQEMDAWDTNGL